ncbi:Zinc finger and BTB domain containing 40 [Elasticomyces elasticus]|nr:Zinc finger and BTB domain containing 40 [Elasticomyces elasticus]
MEVLSLWEAIIEHTTEEFKAIFSRAPNELTPKLFESLASDPSDPKVARTGGNYMLFGATGPRLSLYTGITGAQEWRYSSHVGYISGQQVVPRPMFVSTHFAELNMIPQWIHMAEVTGESKNRGVKEMIESATMIGLGLIHPESLRAYYTIATEGQLYDSVPTVLGCNRELSLMQHLRSEECAWSCRRCGDTFPSKDATLEHLVARHHDLNGYYACSICGWIVSQPRAGPSALRDHLASHSDDRPFSCDDCGATFKSHSALLAHDGRLGCAARQAVCGLGGCTHATDENAMAKHRLTNHDTCDSCGLIVTYDDELVAQGHTAARQQHISECTAEVPGTTVDFTTCASGHKCLADGCTITSKDRLADSVHRKRHFSCEHCGGLKPTDTVRYGHAKGRLREIIEMQADIAHAAHCPDMPEAVRRQLLDSPDPTKCNYGSPHCTFSLLGKLETAFKYKKKIEAHEKLHSQCKNAHLGCTRTFPGQWDGCTAYPGRKEWKVAVAKLKFEHLRTCLDEIAASMTAALQPSDSTATVPSPVAMPSRPVLQPSHPVLQPRSSQNIFKRMMSGDTKDSSSTKKQKTNGKGKENESPTDSKQ